MSDDLRDLATAIGLMPYRCRRSLRRVLAAVYDCGFMNGYDEIDFSGAQPLAHPPVRKHRTRVIDSAMHELTVPLVGKGKKK